MPEQPKRSSDYSSRRTLRITSAVVGLLAAAGLQILLRPRPTSLEQCLAETATDLEGLENNSESFCHAAIESFRTTLGACITRVTGQPQSCSPVNDATHEILTPDEAKSFCKDAAKRRKIGVVCYPQ